MNESFNKKERGRQSEGSLFLRERRKENGVVRESARKRERNTHTRTIIHTHALPRTNANTHAEKERESNTVTERERKIDTETDRQTDRQNEGQRQRETQRQREDKEVFL